MFADSTFSGWKKKGNDRHSIIADPLFVNPAAFDFNFKKLSVVRKIKFVPFDYSKAGVYGSADWKKLAEFDKSFEVKFDNTVESLEAGNKK